jgi:AraC-like DNA-binding protein
MVQIITFLILGRKLVLQYNTRIAEFYSNTETRKLIWVNFFLYGFFATSVISMVFNLIGRSAFTNSINLLLIPSTIFSILLFLIGFHGHIQNYFVEEMETEEKSVADISLKEYSQSLLKDKLLATFAEEKIYKQSDLKITQVALMLQTNRTYISNLINTEFKCTFSEFVNRYRIEEAKNLLSDSKQQNYTLSHIADIAGFGSVNSFIRIFREMEGTTPGKYREKLLLH